MAMSTEGWSSSPYGFAAAPDCTIVPAVRSRIVHFGTTPG